ncbi:MAG: hypothetical protein D6B27_01455 [Gammaproteobacteria bacterium]|nr:MAG: hypothetical protein D6B27_01455 [Gammaproteobacteria bacterium]
MSTTKHIKKKLSQTTIIISWIILSACNEVEDTETGDMYNPPVTEELSYRVSYSVDTCSFEDQSFFVSSLMHDTYLWAEHVPDKNFLQYQSLQQLLNDLVYTTYDHWSYITTKTQSDALSKRGQIISYGFSYKRDNQGIRTIYQVHKDSPAYNAGFRRGDRFVSINGLSYDEITSQGKWGSIWGETELGVSIDITVRDPEGQEKSATLIKEWVTIDIIEDYKIFEENDKKIGYLIFNSFKSYIADDLDEVFNYFIEHEVSELILDLRYNGGGSIWMSNRLSAMIAGTYTLDGNFIHYNFNSRYPHWEHDLEFTDYNYSLNLDRVIIITGNKTCSASELVINGLTPYIEVITIGNTTCGKPVGWNGGYDFCDLHISYPEFQMDNADGIGGYYNGIEATCTAADDIDTQMGESEEESLNTALEYINNGNCKKADKTTKSFSFKYPDDWENNNFGRMHDTR